MLASQGTQHAAPGTQQAPQRPVFRGGANFVVVDAYPTRDGQIVEGLTEAEFQVLEDGRPQKIEAFEFVRIAQGLSESERRDPNNERDALAAAADPHNRVFVVFLDVSHVTVDGSHRVRAPLVDALNRIIAPNDLFGVTTVFQRARDLVLGRRLMSLEEQLSKYWTWGERNNSGIRPIDMQEVMLTSCFHIKLKVDDRRDPKMITPVDWLVSDGPVMRFFDEVLIERLREERVLASLEELLDHIGRIREARTVLMPVTDGWILFEPNRAWEAEPADDARVVQASMPTASDLLRRRREGESLIDFQKCLTEMNRLVAIDDKRRLRELIARANRNNVSFYPVAAGGLAVFDGGGASERVIPNKKAPFGQTILGRDADRVRDRVEGLRTIAENTDGLAIVNTNDLGAGFKRIVNDVSAYYLIGYSSTNAVSDGRFRKIEVKIASPGVTVRARRGYVATTAASAAAPAATASAAVPVNDALGTLARLKSSAEFLVAASASATEIAAVVELASQPAARGTWPQGATVVVEVSDAKGGRVGDATGKVDGVGRGILLRLPVNGVGPWRVRARITGGIDGPLEERLEISADAGKLVGPAIVYRATPAPASPLRPVADYQYRRTERVHLEWPVLAPLDRREARLLGRNGQPLPVPVALTEREVNGRPGLAADVNLAPLSAGDYVIELKAGRGAETEVKLIAIRVVS